MIWRGGVYDIDLGEPVGHEPGFPRPAVVVSADLINQGPGELVVIVPITTTYYRLRSHVEVLPEMSGLGETSYARCDQIRVVATRRVFGRRGHVPPETMFAIEKALRFILDL